MDATPQAFDDLRLYVVRETAWDLNGDVVGVALVAGPYRNTPDGTIEAIEAMREMERRCPGDAFRQIGIADVEVRADRELAAFRRKPLVTVPSALGPKVE